jgi:hypothetical protein
MIPDEMMVQPLGGVNKLYATFDPLATSPLLTLSPDLLTISAATSTTSALSFLTQFKSSGWWSAVFTYSGNANNPYTGLTPDNLDLDTTLQRPSIVYQHIAGRMWYSDDNSALRFDNYWEPAPVAVVTVVVDCDSGEIYIQDPTGTFLKGSGIVTETWGSDFYLWANTNTPDENITSVTLNSGQSPFPTETETLIADLETLKGVTINRGWYEEV